MTRKPLAGSLLVVSFGLYAVWGFGQAPAKLETREPTVETLIRAGQITDAGKRETALRLALGDALLSGTEEQQSAAFDFVTKNLLWIDPRPFSAILEEYGTRHPEKRVEFFLDLERLRRAPREERVVIYLRAARDGGFTLPGGFKLTRADALEIACHEGMVELRGEIVKEATRRTPESDAAGVPSQCLTELELTAGAEYGYTAHRTAAQHLSEMNDEVFRGRIRSDPVFRLLVQNYLPGACVQNPFTKETDPACCTFAKIARRQVELDKRLKRDGLDTPIPTPADPRQLGHYFAAKTWVDSWERTFRDSQCYKIGP